MEGSLKLFVDPSSTCCRKTLMVLCEKGVSFNIGEIDLQNGEQNRDQFLSMNPFGKVPVLTMSDGFTVFESSAIARFVDTMSSKADSLIPDDVRNAAVMEQWISVSNCYAKDYIGTLYYEKYLKQRRGKGPENASIVRGERDRVSKFLAILNKGLEDSPGPYFAGQQFTIADAFLLPEINNLERAQSLDLLKDVPTLRSWYERCTQRESWKKVVAMSQ